MATIVPTPSGTYKALVRMKGWPTTSKTFRLKRDATDWARRTEDEMVRGVFISRSGSERMTAQEALHRYLAEVTPRKKPTTQRSENITAQHLIGFLGKYSMAALSSELVAAYRDHRLEAGKSNNTVRIELAMLSNLFTVAIQEWGLGLTHNPVAMVRKPSPGKGRDRRLADDEEKRLLQAVAQHSNPMLSWVVKLAIETGMRQSEILNLHILIEVGELFFMAWENNETAALIVNPITRFDLDELKELGAEEAWTVLRVPSELTEVIRFRQIDEIELNDKYSWMEGRTIAASFLPVTQPL